MQVTINQQTRELPEGATLADAIRALAPSGPYAAALNLEFVPKSRHAQTALHPGDAIEVIAPVTGG
jgi:sulfur carrier protein